MISVGIESMNVFGGSAALDLNRLADHRSLDRARFQNLLMKEKAVALPFEDPITFAVNAAKPLVDAMTPAERDRIELLITCSESGVDFGKSLSTYIHHHLDLNRNCRLFELKQACYSGTAGFQMAVNFILSQTSPGAKALVITTDISRFVVAEGGDALTEDWSFAEPSAGAGAVAMVIGDRPSIYEVDIGANGYYGYEVMDTCRPLPDSEAGDADLSLLSYLDCCEMAYKQYAERVTGVDYRTSFDHLVFHTPFGGMVKGAHRMMMRKVLRAGPAEIDTDFDRRVRPGIEYCARVGNIMGGTVFLAMVSTVENASFDGPRRIGCFSYGSGCCSEFCSGTVTPEGRVQLAGMGIGKHLDSRHQLTTEEYDAVVRGGRSIAFGTRNVTVDPDFLAESRAPEPDQPRLLLRGIREFHREYEWAR
jgi:polyketide biosynthesis 3-hydroxy-3-methylglutaryl-CoA synthase-like enzyme PksG